MTYSVSSGTLNLTKPKPNLNLHTWCGHWSQSWCQFEGIQPACDFIINPAAGCHYCLPGQRLHFPSLPFS